MDALPLVSVIIPVYNRETLLPEAIESALKQCYKNIEIIVVDDGSTYNTLAVARSFEARIKVYTQSNQGCAVARNTAIQNATGELYAFLDPDDLWMTNKLTDQVKLL